MSLGLKEVLSTNTDFVSRKDEILEGNDKAFSKMNDSEIEIVAKALVQQEIANLEGATEVEDLSKEAQTIFSDIVAWMLERKMRDHEDSIATDNENAEWRESLAELTASVVSTIRSFGPFFQNKEYRKEYRKRFLDDKIDFLKDYESTDVTPLKSAENKLNELNKKINKCGQDIEKLKIAINEYPQKQQPYEDFKNSFNLYNKEQPEENLKVSGTPPTDKFTAWTNTLNTVGIPERDKNDIIRKLVILELECQNLSLKNQDIVKLESFKCEFISKHTDRDHPENLLHIKPNNRPNIEEFHVLEKMYGRDEDSKRGANKQNIWNDPWSSIEDQNSQNKSQYRKFSLWAMCAEITKTQSADEKRRRKDIYNLMFDEFKREFEKELGEQNSAYNTKKEETNKIAGDINNIVVRRLIELVELKKRNIQEKNQKEQENETLQGDKVQAEKDLEYIKSLNGKLPWTTQILPENSGSNTIYKIEYILGGGEPPIIIEKFSYPTQKSVRSRNAAVAKRLILLLLAKKPVEEEDKTESLISQNAPDLAEVVKQIAFLGKTGVRVYKTSKASSNGRKKRAFARAADCYGAIPVVLRATLASLEAGFAFNKDKEREAI
jgi:hypothetical protein